MTELTILDARILAAKQELAWIEDFEERLYGRDEKAETALLVAAAKQAEAAAAAARAIAGEDEEDGGGVSGEADAAAEPNASSENIGKPESPESGSGSGSRVTSGVSGGGGAETGNG